MREVNFTHNGGLPFSQNVTAFMQGTYSLQFGALAGLLGDKVILSGVEVSAGNVTAGWITFGGMIIPFEGGLLASRVDIITSTSDLLYEDGQTKQAYTTRVARCVTVGGFEFSELRRLSSYRSLMDMLVPRGIISMWSGIMPPAGWALCDGGGSPARPDLRGRFIVGYDPGDPDYSAIGVGADLGRKQVHLEVLNLPNHRHTVSGVGNTNDFGMNSDFESTGGGGSTLFRSNVQTTDTGGGAQGQPHENRPPYYTLAYIIKL